ARASPPARRRSADCRTPSRVGPSARSRVSLLRRAGQGQEAGHLSGAGFRTRGGTRMTAHELAAGGGKPMQTFNLNDLVAESERADQRWREFLRVPSLSMGL